MGTGALSWGGRVAGVENGCCIPFCASHALWGDLYLYLYTNIRTITTYVPNIMIWYVCCGWLVFLSTLQKWSSVNAVVPDPAVLYVLHCWQRAHHYKLKNSELYLLSINNVISLVSNSAGPRIRMETGLECCRGLSFMWI